MAVSPLSPEDLKWARDGLTAAFLDGRCYELAIALHRGTGLPLVGLWSPTASGDDGVPGTWRHAAVRLGESFVDARGIVSSDRFGLPFGEPKPWDVRDITEADLLQVRRVEMHSLQTIMSLAYAAFPHLPWREDCWHLRAAAFLRDLEQLSRQHGIWIRAPYPAGRPVLGPSHGDEKGYKAETCSLGLNVLFDREL